MSDPLRGRARRGRRGRARARRPRRHGRRTPATGPAASAARPASSSGPATPREVAEPCCGAAPRPARARRAPGRQHRASSAAACRATQPMVVLSTRRLDDLGPVDAGAMQVTAGAGVTLAAWRSHARAAGLDAPVDFASRDSATVGGAVATNAGGSRVVRFGTMRAQVVGVERRARRRLARSARWPGCPRRRVGLHWPSLLCRQRGHARRGHGGPAARSCRGTGTRRRRWSRRPASSDAVAVLAALRAECAAPRRRRADPARGDGRSSPPTSARRRRSVPDGDRCLRRRRVRRPRRPDRRADGRARRAARDPRRRRHDRGSGPRPPRGVP